MRSASRVRPAQRVLRPSPFAFEPGFAHAPAFPRCFKSQLGFMPKDIGALAMRPLGKDMPFLPSPTVLAQIQPTDR
jgi:hypothetical protein